MADNTTVPKEDLPIYIASVNIWKYTPPILIIIGTVANILSIIVLLRKSMRLSTTMFYLTVLAFGDILVLYTGLLRYWIQYAFDINLRELSNIGCKLHVFLVYFSLDFSTWILVAVTIDRCIFVCLPFKSKSYCTMRNAKIAVCSIVFVLVLLNCHLFGTVALVENAGCIGVEGFILSTWPWIDFCAFCIGPFTVMIVCNIFIIRQIVLSNRRIESHSGSGMLNPKDEMITPSTSAALANGNSTTVGALQHLNKTNKKRKRLKKISNITIMLLTVNFVYFICTLPIAVYLIGYRVWVPGASPEKTATLDLIWAISNFLQYTNNTIHFFMYCLTSPKFRKELFLLFNITIKANDQQLEQSKMYHSDHDNVKLTKTTRY